jgi:stearoyl-CoA desaturase (Delta-9 desaturase)
MTSTLERSAHQEGPQPMVAGEKSRTQTLLVKLFAIVPLVALVAAIPFAWGWGLGWADIGLTLFFYTLTCLGVTVGFHRYSQDSVRPVRPRSGFSVIRKFPNFMSGYR